MRDSFLISNTWTTPQCHSHHECNRGYRSGGGGVPKLRSQDSEKGAIHIASYLVVQYIVWLGGIYTYMFWP